MRKAADLIDKRIYEFGVVMSLEVGKNRMEALGDAAESADLIRYACDQMEANKGYVARMGKDPFKGYSATNTSVLRPYGVWVVISPFNFPCALTAGPAGAALVAGNTLVMKPATNTPWTVRLLAECLRDAGVPDGAFNYVTGPGSSIGQELIDNPEVDGITFTGSYDIGMGILRSFANGRYARPTILELGGKNPAIVSRKADLDRAAIGILRSAFGLQGQKCSACSRVFIERPVYQKLVDRLADLTRKLVVGDPTDRSVYTGPVINRSSYKDFQDFCAELGKSGKFLTGGKVLTDGALAKGFFCAPTLVVDLAARAPFVEVRDVPADHDARAGRQPRSGDGPGQRRQLRADGGLLRERKGTAWFFDKIEAGVTYVNRPQGATTGAWPGFQPFGGWKGSGSSGKNAGGLYYLPLYMHEQIQTLIK